MILAIRAPPGSKIEVPSAEESNPTKNDFKDLYSYLGKKYKINIDSRGT
jgi:hypothetical protein